MITLKMLNQLATCLLNADERFAPLKGDLLVQFTEAGLRQVENAWFSREDAEYCLILQDFAEMLEQLLWDMDLTETIEVVDQLPPFDLISLLAMAFYQTFECYANKGSFYEFVTLESYDFEFLGRHFFFSHEFSLENFKLEMDELQSTLDGFIEFKGYTFVKNQFVMTE